MTDAKADPASLSGALAMPPLSLIAAMTDTRVIGKNGGLPWHVPEDLKHFKRLSTGHAIVMGRKTFESVGRPLPNRTNIVVSRSAGFSAPGCRVFSSLADAIAYARTVDAEPMIIGGAELYRLAMPKVTRMFLTFIHENVEGDTFFPEFESGDGAEWRETERRLGESSNVEFVTLERQTRPL